MQIGIASLTQPWSYRDIDRHTRIRKTLAILDKITKQQRSANMARIRSKNTRPELAVRRALYARGIRYRIHNTRLPGRPDISIMKYRIVIDIRGCFWHGHQGCKFSSHPSTNPDYWILKIRKNMDRDARNIYLWEGLGYSVFVVWECETKKSSAFESQINLIGSYVRNFTSNNVLPCKPREIFDCRIHQT